MNPLSLPLAEFSAADFEKQGRLLRAISPFSRGIVVRRPLFSSPAVNIQDSFFTSLMRSFSRCFATLCCLLGRKYALRIHLYGSRILSFCADAVNGKCKVKLEQFYFFFSLNGFLVTRVTSFNFQVIRSRKFFVYIRRIYRRLLS